MPPISFCRFNEQLIVLSFVFKSNNFVFCQKRAQTVQSSRQNLAECLELHFHHFLVGCFSLFNSQLLDQTEISDLSARTIFVYNEVISLREFVNYYELS